MNCYGVKLIFVNNVVSDPDVNLLDENYIKDYIAYEESIILVQAKSFDEAYEKVEKYAKDNEDDYQNIYGQTIQERFYDSIDCFLIGEADGLQFNEIVEVYSNIIESNIKENQKEFLQGLFPIFDKPKYMLLNKQFSRSKTDKDYKEFL